MSNFKKLSAINIKDLIAKTGKHSYRGPVPGV